MRSLLHLRQILEVGIEEDGSLKDKTLQEMLKAVVEALAGAARKFAFP
jgi:hypothetical protein